MKSLAKLAVLFAAIAGTASGFTFDDLLKTICLERTFICRFNGKCCKSDSQICSNKSLTCEDVFLEKEDRDKVCCDVLYKNDTTRKGLLSACVNRLGSVTWQSYCKAVNGRLTLDDLLEVRCAADSHMCPSSGNCCKSDSQACNRTSGKCEPVFEDGEDVDQVCCDALEKNDTSREGLLSACWSRLGTVAWQGYCKDIPENRDNSERQGCTTEITISVIVTLFGTIIIFFLIYHFCWKRRTNVQNRNTRAVSYQSCENIQNKPSETQESQSSADEDEGLPRPVVRGNASPYDQHQEDVDIHENGDAPPSGSREDEQDVVIHENGEGSVQESSSSVQCQTLDTRDEEPTERDRLLE